MASSVRSWVLKALVDFKIFEKEVTSILMPAIRVLLLREDASNEEKIEALEKLEMEFQNLTPTRHNDETC